MSDDFIYALTNSRLPSLKEWQRAIDQWDLLVPVKLLTISIGQDRLSRLLMDGAEVDFICVDAEPPVVLGERFPESRTRWSSAYGFRGLDRHRQFYAAAVACMSCAMAAGGAFLGFGNPPTADLSHFRRDMDLFLTATLKRDDLFYGRYPEERPTEPSPRAALIITHD